MIFAVFLFKLGNNRLRILIHIYQVVAGTSAGQKPISDRTGFHPSKCPPCCLVRAKTSRRTLSEDILAALVTAALFSGCNRSPADTEPLHRVSRFTTEFRHARQNGGRLTRRPVALTPFGPTV